MVESPQFPHFFLASATISDRFPNNLHLTQYLGKIRTLDLLLSIVIKAPAFMLKLEALQLLQPAMQHRKGLHKYQLLQDRDKP